MTGGNGSKDYLLAQIRGGGTLSGGQQLKLCLMLSYPAIIAQVSSVLMQYIDTSMVGHLGAAAGASIGLVSTCMWLWLLMGFCGACGSGFSVQVAHLIGANDFKTAREVLRQALVSALCFSGAIAVLGMAIAGPLPRWLGGTPEIIPDATKYFFIVSAFLPFMQLDWICASMLQVSGNMKVPSYLNIGMCLMDVCFNYLFIYVLDLGVVGAALGTGLAELITAMAMLYFLTVRSPELNLRQDKGSFKPTGKVIAKAAGIGGPMALQNVLIRGGYIASTVIVAPLGTIAIAANSFAITAESFCYMPGYGIADAATALVGQSVGAGRKELAKRFQALCLDHHRAGYGDHGPAGHPDVRLRSRDDADALPGRGSHLPGRPCPTDRSVRGTGLCGVHRRLRRLRGRRRHQVAERDEFHIHVDRTHPPRHLPGEGLWSRGLLDRHGRRAHFPRPSSCASREGNG